MDGSRFRAGWGAERVVLLDPRAPIAAVLYRREEVEGVLLGLEIW